MKNIRRPQQFRLQRILEMIRAGTQRGRLPSAADFSRELGVSRRTIMSDLDRLRDDENAPIEYEPRRHGYRLTDLTWELPAIQISRQEVIAPENP